MSVTQAITTTPELGAIRITASQDLVRLCFSHDTERWLFARYYQVIQDKSETLLSLRDTIEHYRTTPYPVLFEEMKG